MFKISDNVYLEWFEPSLHDGANEKDKGSSHCFDNFEVIYDKHMQEQQDEFPESVH
jgi:hypothetical protein